MLGEQKTTGIKLEFGLCPQVGDRPIWKKNIQLKL